MNYGRRQGWKKNNRRRELPAVPIVVLSIFIVVGLAAVVAAFRPGPEAPPAAAPVVEVTSPPGSNPGEIPEASLDKKDLAGLLGDRSFETDQQRIMEITDQSGNQLYVRTTILPRLQTLGDGWVKGSRAHQAALVVMNPDTGEVLTLAGHRADGEKSNAALASSFPAASLFKIVTAAAAVEKGELSADSKVAYDGGKHTLYKNNVNKEPDKGRQTATLKESFAESINTVFGKLGAFTLGPEELADFAGRFGFNHDIDFELPVEASSFTVDENDTFRVAELASGFNRSTKVSPLHGALMAAAIVAGGTLHEPRIVREVFDRENHIYYQAGEDAPREVISPATAAELSQLMRSAVEEGTGRRVLGAAVREHPVLSRLVIGGKSGTINDDAGRRVDWFVAWAEPRPDTGCRDRLALSAMVVHTGQTNTTSQKLVRDALAAYYQERLGLNKKRAATGAPARKGG